MMGDRIKKPVQAIQKDSNERWIIKSSVEIYHATIFLLSFD